MHTLHAPCRPLLLVLLLVLLPLADVAAQSSPSRSASVSASQSRRASTSRSITRSASAFVTASRSASASVRASASASRSRSATATRTGSKTRSRLASATPSASPVSATSTGTATATKVSATGTRTATASAPATATATATKMSASRTATATASPPPTPTPLPPAAFLLACPGLARAAQFTLSSGMATTRFVVPAWLPLPLLDAVQTWAASPDAKTVFAFGTRFSASSAVSWNRSSYAWEQESGAGSLASLGLPAGAVTVYKTDIGMTGAIWLVLIDGAGATRVFTRSPSRLQLLGEVDPEPPIFSEVRAGACGVLPAIGGLSSLPNGNALGFSAAPPYKLIAWSPAGCLGVANFSALPGATGRAPMGLRLSAKTYTQYSVLLAVGPAGCAANTTCASGVGAAVLRAAVTFTNFAATLLAPAAWAAVALPAGTAAAILDVSVASSKVFAVAPFCVNVTAVIPRCRCGVTGFPLLSTTTAGVTWATVGCVPIVPTSVSVHSDSALYVAGVAIAAVGGPAVVASADGGVTWNILRTPPSTVVAGCDLAAGGLALTPLAMHGGPVFISGMDPAHHGDPNDGPTACSPTAAMLSASYPTCLGPAQMCPTWGFVKNIMSLVQQSATVPSTSDVAVLGVDPTSPSGLALKGNAGAVWLSLCNLGLSATYWFGQSVTGRTIPAFFNALAWGNVTPSMIFIAEARSTLPISTADQLLLANYAPAIAEFVSRGGGLFVNTQYSTAPHYEFLLKWAPFLTIRLTGATSLQTPSLTDNGMALFPSLKSNLAYNPNLQGQWHQ